MHKDGISCSKDLGIKQNVTFRIIDEITGKVVSEHKGHNQATNSMLTGIAHYLKGDGILNQAQHMLSQHIPMYISLGTMGLVDQEEDIFGLPTSIGDSLTDNDGSAKSEEARFKSYISTMPGYGADGYDANRNNSRKYMGLGPVFADRDSAFTAEPHTVDCELISETFPRAPITYRELVPESHAELPETIDIIFSAMISTGALAQFREDGKDYVFITEAGLWSTDVWTDTASNGLLAGYRIAPPDEENWDMSVESNRQLLKQSILKVRKNQVVQVIWKIQLGSHRQLISKKLGCDCTCPSASCPCHGGKEPEPDITIQDKTITIIPDSYTLNQGDSYQLRLQIITTYTDGNVEVIDWTPEDITAPVIDWTSSDPSIISVQNGMVTAHSTGSVTITARLREDTGISDTAIIYCKVDLPIDDNIISYAVVSTGDLTLGARDKITANQLAIGSQIFWQASDSDNNGTIIGYGENAGMYLLGVNDNPIVTSSGSNYFDIDIYAPESILPLSDRYSVSNTVGSIHRTGSEYSLPADYVQPSINLIDLGSNSTQSLPHIDGQAGRTIIITELEAIILSDLPTADTADSKTSYTLSDGRIVSGYLVPEYGTTSDTRKPVMLTAYEHTSDGDVAFDVSAYGSFHINASADRPVHVYIEPGNYATYQILTSGNNSTIEFVSAKPDTPTFIYVEERVMLGNDNYIVNTGDARSGLIYCGGANMTESDGSEYVSFSCDTHNNLRFYVEAPNGTIKVDNDCIVQGCLYAENIVLGNDVQVIIE